MTCTGLSKIQWLQLFNRYSTWPIEAKLSLSMGQIGQTFLFIGCRSKALKLTNLKTQLSIRIFWLLWSLGFQCGFSKWPLSTDVFNIIIIMMMPYKPLDFSHSITLFSAASAHTSPTRPSFPLTWFCWASPTGTGKLKQKSPINHLPLAYNHNHTHARGHMHTPTHTSFLLVPISQTSCRAFRTHWLQS